MVDPAASPRTLQATRSRLPLPFFTCPVPTCNKTFQRRFRLKEHITTHTGDKPYVCSVDSCLRGFTTSGNLARHQRVRHPWLDTPFECLVDKNCGCTFSTERLLERHMTMVHFNASPYACPVKYCGRAFSTAGNLRRHMNQRHSALDTEKQRQNTPISPTAIDVLKVEDSDAPVSRHSPDTTYFDTELLDVLACLFD